MRSIFPAAIVLLAAIAVAGGAFLWLGAPVPARQYHVKNEIARFSPTLGHGALQLGAETFLLVVVAYSGRRWLRIRL